MTKYNFDFTSSDEIIGGVHEALVEAGINARLDNWVLDTGPLTTVTVAAVFVYGQFFTGRIITWGDNISLTRELVLASDSGYCVPAPSDPLLFELADPESLGALVERCSKL